MVSFLTQSIKNILALMYDPHNLDHNSKALRRFFIMKTKKTSRKTVRYLLYALFCAALLISALFIYSIFIYNDVPSTFIPAISYNIKPAQYLNPIEKTKGAVPVLIEYGKLFLVNNNGELFQIVCYSSFHKDDSKFTFLTDSFKRISIDSSSLKIFAKTDLGEMFFSFNQDETNKKISIESKILFSDSIQLERHSIILLPFYDVKALRLKNDDVVYNNFEDEYWLGKKGMIELGNQENILLLEGEKVSSIQYSTEKNQIWINADYYGDHLFYHIIENGNGALTEKSFNEYAKGDSLISSFNVYFNRHLSNFPILSQFKDGFLSTIIWTEHADNAILETHKAVYYGSSKINKPEDAAGGFVKYSIPVTKSIFFSNIDSSTNTAFNSENNELQSAITTDPEYFNFLIDLYQTGNYEIALHTLDPANDIVLEAAHKASEIDFRISSTFPLFLTREMCNYFTGFIIPPFSFSNIPLLQSSSSPLLQFSSSATVSDSIHASMHLYPLKLQRRGASSQTASIDSAFSFMQAAFNTVTWIDHGMSDGFGNRESFAADGLVTGSKHFMSDYWKEYGIKYFWNTSFEKYFDCGGLKQKLYNLELVKFIHCYFDRIIGTRNYYMTGDGEHVPAPVYWQNNIHPDNFYSWGTLRASGHHPGWVWDYKYSESVLNRLVEERGLNIIHAYPAFVGRRPGYSNGMWEEVDGEYKINSDFDSVLKRMAEYREKGLINLSTIKDNLDFQIALEKVEIIPLINGRFKIVNKNNYAVDGITFYLNKDYEIETTSEVESKFYKDNIYYWFSLRAKEVLEITVKRTLR